MAIAEPTVPVIPVVTKNYAYASASPDECSTEIGGYRFVKALRLGRYDSCEIEICMTFSVKACIYSVQHNCAPLATCMARPGVRHGIILADAVRTSS
jgi:hypothetical protein